MIEPTPEQTEWMALAFKAGLDRLDVVDIIYLSLLTGKSCIEVKNIKLDSQIIALKGERAHSKKFLEDMPPLPEGGSFFKPS